MSEDLSFVLLAGSTCLVAQIYLFYYIGSVFAFWNIILYTRVKFLSEEYSWDFSTEMYIFSSNYLMAFNSLAIIILVWLILQSSSSWLKNIAYLTVVLSRKYYYFSLNSNLFLCCAYASLRCFLCCVQIEWRIEGHGESCFAIVSFYFCFWFLWALFVCYVSNRLTSSLYDKWSRADKDAKNNAYALHIFCGSFLFLVLRHECCLYVLFI